jgi:hypothetical protein
MISDSLFTENALNAVADIDPNAERILDATAVTPRPRESQQ